jgi:hypothetical protein
MVPKVIWFPSIFELLFDESEKPVKFMTPTPKAPTAGANWQGLISTMSQTKDLRSGKEGVG